MSKLLLIEPDRMLRQAFTVALSPEFEIQVVNSIADAAPNDFDALIVDAAALQEREPQSAPVIRPLAAWHLPIIWIDSDQSAQAPDHDRCIRFNRPVSKELLRRALAQCLSAVAVPESSSGLRAETRKTARRPKRNTKEARNSATGEGANVIELVDVVEASTAR